MDARANRDFARAEADYLRHPTERAPRCPCCVEPFDPDHGVELDADAADILALTAGEIVCADCATTAREDVAMVDAMVALGLLGPRWAARAAKAVRS